MDSCFLVVRRWRHWKLVSEYVDIGLYSLLDFSEQVCRARLSAFLASDWLGILQQKDR